MTLDLQNLNLDRATQVCRARLAELGPEKTKAVGEALAVDFNEHFDYQQLQAQAHGVGEISTADAQLIYASLGELGSESNGGWAADTDTATKYVVTRVIEEIITQRLAKRAVVTC
jgi:hypothetical protein